MHNSYNKLISAIKSKKSMLCVGLDSDISKIPAESFSKNINGLFEFNKTIIAQTADICAAYKINFAFYEQYGSDGVDLLKQTLQIIPQDIFTIADAKRGDIGNTSTAYSKSVFQYFMADSITVNPYMGIDSIVPFLEDTDKFIFLLALTSNKGSYDFQRLECDGKPLYLHIIEKSAKEFEVENLGFVIGATHPTELGDIRKLIPNNAVLIPGVGAQGGDVSAVMAANGGGPALINVSRAVIYPDIIDNDFGASVRRAALKYNRLINLTTSTFLKEWG
ncbi:MAG: orotidine-5'-phosphate decarboxylase [Ignavibacteria bacterium]|nr:orotidine-5'-phosphate decarboxylase [Ignavibacteria bacterium]